MTERKIRVEFKIFVDGNAEPEIEGYSRVPWLVDETLDDLMMRVVHEACAQLKRRDLVQLA